MRNKILLPERRFRDYAETFRDPDGSFPPAVRQKIDHTFDVCRITAEIVRREHDTPEDAFLFHICALFHDLSRFEQYRKFHTFRDALSFDHGARSAELMLSGDFVKELTPDERELAAAAIRAHNKPRLPDTMPEAFLPAAKTVRDADKISILKLILTLAEHPEQRDPAMTLELPASPGCTPSILQAVLTGNRVLYTEMRNINDFLLSLFSWSMDINRPSAAAILLESGLYGQLAGYLDDIPGKDGILDLTHARLRAAAKTGDAS